MAKIFLVSIVEKSRDVLVGGDGGIPVSVDMSWSDGMIGVMPVFATIEDAQRYAGKGIVIHEAEIEGG